MKWIIWEEVILFDFQKDTFSENARGIAKIWHEVLLKCSFCRPNLQSNVWKIIVTNCIIQLIKMEMRMDWRSRWLL